MSTLPLFEEPLPPLAEKLAPKLKELAGQGVLIGTSSWKYEGWMGQIYSEHRYMTRGRFSQKKFQSECLDEYAKVFPIVCGDFSFYQFPSPAYWSQLFHSAPQSLQFAFKAPEEVTAKRFAKHDRYGNRAGMENEMFLGAEQFRSGFLELLEPYRGQVAVIIFEFGTFAQASYESVEPFVADLDGFLGALPKEWRYAVEIRNPEYLGMAYWECLRRHGVAHVFNAWTRMPELERQTGMEGAYTADFVVARALLRHGRPYEEAVEKFSPYTRIQEVNPGARKGLKELIQRSRAKQKPAFLFVNNRLEGNAPQTIEAILE